MRRCSSSYVLRNEPTPQYNSDRFVIAPLSPCNPMTATSPLAVSGILTNLLEHTYGCLCASPLSSATLAGARDEGVIELQRETSVALFLLHMV